MKIPTSTAERHAVLKQIGITPKQIADGVLLSVGTVENVLCGGRATSPKAQQRITHYVGVELFRGVKPKPLGMETIGFIPVDFFDFPSEEAATDFWAEAVRGTHNIQIRREGCRVLFGRKVFALLKVLPAPET